MNDKGRPLSGPVPVHRPFGLQEHMAAYHQVAEMGASESGQRPGRIELLGWDLEYVSAPALATFIDQILVRRLNDFIPDRARPLILDCGANIGLSVLNYKRQLPDSRIIAFEPDPMFVSLLRNNLQRNGAAGVEVVEAAVWVSTGQAQWFCEGVDGSRLAVDPGDPAGTVVVPTVDLAGYLHEPVDLLKLDIEGAEYAVVCHLGERLRAVKNMSIECHLNQAQIRPFSKMLETLAAVGFNVSINSFGTWRDLIRQPAPLTPIHWEQYLVVAAWRAAAPSDTVEDPWLSPYIDAGLRKGLVDAHTQLRAAKVTLQNYELSRLARLVRWLGGW